MARLRSTATKSWRVADGDRRPPLRPFRNGRFAGKRSWAPLIAPLGSQDEVIRLPASSIRVGSGGLCFLATRKSRLAGGARAGYDSPARLDALLDGQSDNRTTRDNLRPREHYAGGIWSRQSDRDPPAGIPTDDSVAALKEEASGEPSVHPDSVGDPPVRGDSAYGVPVRASRAPGSRQDERKDEGNSEESNNKREHPLHAHAAISLRPDETRVDWASVRECHPEAPEDRSRGRTAAQKTNARSPRFFKGSLYVPRLATTKKRRCVEDVTVKVIVSLPIQNPTTCLGTCSVGLAIATTLPG
jgi:hypothetical protein